MTTIDFEELEIAMTLEGGETTAYLDVQTGEVLMIFDDFEESEEMEARVDADPKRYRVIDPFDTRDDYRTMESFAATCEDELRDALDDALSGRRGVFSRFRAVLELHPQHLERWYTHRTEHRAARARAWLESEGIEATLRMRTPVSG